MDGKAVVAALPRQPHGTAVDCLIRLSGARQDNPKPGLDGNPKQSAQCVVTHSSTHAYAREPQTMPFSHPVIGLLPLLTATFAKRKATRLA